MDAFLRAPVPPASFRRSEFGSDFIFGSATSAFQIEGACSKDGRGPSIWDTFATANAKNLFEPYGEDAVCHYEKYEEDLETMKKIGFDAYRFSISWSRILPTGKRESRNQAGIEFYKKLLRKLKDNKVKTFVTLLHFDPPQALETEYQGFLNRKIVDDLGVYADICFQEFGSLVDYWITIHEPWSFAYAGYVKESHAPGRGTVKDQLLTIQYSNLNAISLGNKLVFHKDDDDDDEEISMFPPSRFSVSSSMQKRFRPRRSNPGTSTTIMMSKDADFEASQGLLLKGEVSDTNADEVEEENSEQLKEPYRVVHHLLLAHAKAVDIYREKYQKIQEGKIGITLVSMWCPPFSDNPIDVEASERAMDFMLGWFMGPLVKGEYPDRMKTHASEGQLPEMGDDKKLIQKLLRLHRIEVLYWSICSP